MADDMVQTSVSAVYEPGDTRSRDVIHYALVLHEVNSASWLVAAREGRHSKYTARIVIGKRLLAHARLYRFQVSVISIRARTPCVPLSIRSSSGNHPLYRRKRAD
jgi:hypothetical protein